MRVNTQELWQAALGELELTISKASFGTWFKNTAILSVSNDHIIIAVPNIFTKEWLEKKYRKEIEVALKKLVEFKTIEYKIASPKDVIAEPEPANEPQQKTKQPNVSGPASARVPMHITLNPKYTFDTFVVGSSNQLAYAACQAVAKNPGHKYNPLFLYGGVGLGKTHLMQAVGNAIVQADSSKRIEYVTSEAFTNEFVSSISRKRTEDFAKKFRNIDVLIVDDVQFLAQKERTVEEFFHTFNTLHQSNKQIILSSDRPPQAITGLEDRLRSRFESGMMADIQQPDLETRAAILQTKAASQQFLLPLDVSNFMAQHIKHNIRELEGALTRVIAHCEFHGVEPTVPVVTAVLGNQVSGKPKRVSVSPKALIEKVASYYDLKADEITGPKRDREIVVPRQIAMYLMRHELNLSFPKIAAVCGGRDHTTAMHSVVKIEKLLEVDEPLREEYQAVRNRVFIG